MGAEQTSPSAPAATPVESGDMYEFAVESRSEWSRIRRRFLRNRPGVVGAALLTLLFGAGLLAHHLAPFGYLEVNINALSSPPTWAHPFGTDQAGRDYFSRTLFGIGTEAEITFMVGFLGSLIGMLVGAIAGYFGGLLDNLLMRGADLMLALPTLVVVLVAAAYLNVRTSLAAAVVLACVLWSPVARVVRGTCLSLREKEYVDAARAVGAGNLRILRRHVLPNAVGPMAVAASLMTGAAVLLETTISFLGFGIARGYRGETRTPSIGDVLAYAQAEGLYHWWGIVFPGLTIVLIVVSINFVGEGLREAFDPTARRFVDEPPRTRRKRPRPGWLTNLFGLVPRPEFPSLAATTVAGRLAPWRNRVATLAAIADSLRNRASNWRVAHRRLRLSLEAFVVLVLTAGAAAAIYVSNARTVDSPWRAAGIDVQNVSRARGAQTEISLAAGPSDPRVLFAASNDSQLRTIRVYTSSDGGRTWASSPGPSLGANACARGDPTATIAPDGREYVAFIVSAYCTSDDTTPYLVVATRRKPRAAWTVRRVVTQRSNTAFDDKPAIATAPGGRAFVAWSRLLGWTYETTVVSSSNDGGRSWSSPRVVDRRLAYPQLVNITVGPSGILYVAGVDARFGIWVARSDDSGAHFRLRRAAPLPGNQASSCIAVGNHPIPFQANRCLGPNPTVVALSNRVYVTYGVGGASQRQSVRIAVVDSSLHLLWRGPIGPATSKADRFWPVSAVDARSERLWACFYDTTGDSSGQKAWFSCTLSSDGRHWTTPVRTTRTSVSPFVLWEDARIYGFGDTVGYGGYPALALAGGSAHVMWTDTRDLGGRAQEVFAARIPVKTVP